MIEALKRAAQIEWDNIRDPDSRFAWIVIAATVLFILTMVWVKS